MSDVEITYNGQRYVKADEECDMHRAWEEGRVAGDRHQNNLWLWSAGDLTRRVMGLTERPVAPTNPYPLTITEEKQ